MSPVTTHKGAQNTVESKLALVLLAQVKKAKKKDIGGFDASFKSGLGSNSDADVRATDSYYRLAVRSVPPSNARLRVFAAR